MDWLELTSTEQEGGSDEDLVGSEVVCDLEERETAKDENGLGDNHGAPPRRLREERARPLALEKMLSSS